LPPPDFAGAQTEGCQGGGGLSVYGRLCGPGTWTQRHLNKSELLKELRIDRDAPQDGPPSRLRLWLAAGVAAVVAVGLFLFLTSRDEAIEVTVAEARPMPATSAGTSVLDATGYVTARRQATVSAKITGKVREVRIEEGQRVEAGEILATLDDSETRVDAALRRAQVAEARAQLAEVEAGSANADREYRRQQDLAERKLTSVSTLDAARTQAEALRARVSSQMSAIKVAQEALAAAQVQLDNTVVRAPFAGVVTVKAAQPGEMISPISAGGGSIRTGIGTIVDMDSLEIQVDVSEAYINRVQPGQKVEAVLNAYPDWRIPASVIAIVPTADRSKATVKVRIALGAKDTRIVPEMGVRVAFLESGAAQANAPATPRGVLVPAAAIRQDDGKDVVFLMRDGRAERRAVTAGGAVGDDRQVRAGVSAGDSVIVTAPAPLEDGDVVTARELGDE
jgi:RND family efflux transporter MFP subunit